jgi:hypothetical protein
MRKPNKPIVRNGLLLTQDAEPGEFNAVPGWVAVMVCLAGQQPGFIFEGGWDI